MIMTIVAALVPRIPHMNKKSPEAKLDDKT
jgi:hypothetical protein